LSAFEAVADIGNKAEAVSSAVKRLFGNLMPKSKKEGQPMQVGTRGRSIRSVGSGVGRRALTEFVVIALLLAIPSKIIWDMRSANLAYIANTHAQRAAVQEQIAQGQSLLPKLQSYKALQAQNLLKVPKGVGYSGIVSTLTTLAERTGVELVTVSAPSKRPAPIAGSVYQWTVNTTITGSFPAIQSYIDTLQSEPRLYQVTQVQIGVANAGSSAAAGPGGPGAAVHAQGFSGGIDNAVLTIDVETLA